LVATAQVPKDSFLAVPTNQSIEFILHGRGVQIYVSKSTAANTKALEWALKGPDAKLFDARGNAMGKHYAGPKGPRWELNNGSIIEGRIKVPAAISSPKDVPWLLISTNLVVTRARAFESVDYVLRDDTIGGVAPTTAPKRFGQEVRVKYEATYMFLMPTVSY
jgi:hypothetical protein